MSHEPSIPFHPRSTVERLASDHDYIDVRMLHRRGALTDSWVTFAPMLGWRGIGKIHASQYLVLVEWCDQVDPQTISVSWTRLHFGGGRPWLHCPCGRRVVRLLKGRVCYQCRQCLGNPPYASQCKSTQGRWHFEACKIRLRLNGVASLAEPFPERPRGMHKKTYDRLRRRAEQLEARISPRVRGRPTDYPSLVHYLPPLVSREFRRSRRSRDNDRLLAENYSNLSP
jgi:hypothetical protein